MVQTRRGTHVSPTPAQQSSPEEETEEPVPTRPQRQTRNTSKVNNTNANSKKGKHVPEHMLDLLVDELSSSQANKRQRIQQGDDEEEEVEDDDDRVEVNFDLVNDGIRGSLPAAELEGPDEQLQREASERPQTAEGVSHQQGESSNRGRSAGPRSRAQKSRRAQSRMHRLPVVLSVHNEDAPLERNLPPPITSESRQQVEQVLADDADEDGDIPPPEEAFHAPAPNAESEVADAEESMFVDEDAGEQILDFGNLPELGDEQFVEIKVGSLANMLKQMGKSGWTSHGSRWEAKIGREMNRNLNSSRSPNTKHCRNIWNATHRLWNIFQNGSPFRTLEELNDFLNEKAHEIERTLGHITKLVDLTCDKKLAEPQVDEQLSEEVLDFRKKMTQDMIYYCIPAILIVLRTTFLLAGAENPARARAKGRFTNKTLEFLFKETQWLLQLAVVVVRELEERPFERQFTTAENRLSQGDIVKREQKLKSREAFRRNLGDFRDSLQGVIDKLKEKQREEEERKQEAEDRQRRAEMAEDLEREARIHEQQKKAQKKERFLTQWQAFVASTQDIRARTDPVKRKWDEAMEEEQEFRETVEQRSSQASQQWVASTHALRNVPDPVGARWVWGRDRSTHPLAEANDEPFGDDGEQGQSQHEPDQFYDLVWPDWRADEDDIIRVELKYSRTLNVPRIAKKLNRDEHDVKQHIQEMIGGRVVPGL